MKKLFLLSSLIFVGCIFCISIASSQTMSYEVMEGGGWQVPKGRVQIGEDIQAPMQATIGERTFDCRQVYQEGVDIKSNESGKTKRIKITGVTGHPFPIEPLKVNKNATLIKTIIHIDEVEGKYFVPSKESAVPIYLEIDPVGNLEIDIEKYTRAVNVTWIFTTPEITFTANGYLYIVQKEGAYIAFTEKGLKMDGIRKTKKR